MEWKRCFHERSSRLFEDHGDLILPCEQVPEELGLESPRVLNTHADFAAVVEEHLIDEEFLDESEAEVVS